MEEMLDQLIAYLLNEKKAYRDMYIPCLLYTSVPKSLEKLIDRRLCEFTEFF